jgi:hypothetical protein
VQREALVVDRTLLERARFAAKNIGVESGHVVFA